MEFIRSLKRDKPCSICGGWFPDAALDFHHREPSSKLFTISSCGTRTFTQIRAEVEKCDLICSNCHRVLTQVEGHHRPDRMTSDPDGSDSFARFVNEEEVA